MPLPTLRAAVRADRVAQPRGLLVEALNVLLVPFAVGSQHVAVDMQRVERVSHGRDVEAAPGLVGLDGAVNPGMFSLTLFSAPRASPSIA
jgi:hypothetical protein